MSGISGFPTQQKTTTARPNFVTVAPAGSGKHGLDVASKAYFRVGAIQTVVSFTPNTKTLEITAHGAILGDILRFESGANAFIEVPITKIIDVDNVEIASEVLVSAPINTDTLYIMRGSSNRCDTSGAQLITSGPTQFVLDGVDTAVEEDTTSSANNIPLPTKLIIEYNGNNEPVHYDGNPLNTVAIPVALTNLADGTPINISAGDLNVNIHHTGPNPSSVRIGDGTTEAGVTLNNELKTHDEDVLVKVTSIEGKDFATETTLASIDTKLGSALPLPTGASTLSEQQSQTTKLTSIDSKLTSPLTVTGPLTDTELRATPVPVSGTVSVGNFPATQPVSAVSLPLPTGASTLAEQQTQTTKLTSIDGKDFATQTTLSALNTKIPSNLTVTSTRLLVDGSGVTQPVSASSLPLPTGASTLTEQQSQTTKLTSIDGKDFATQTTLSALNTKVTSVASTPISTRDSDGTDFISSIALAASQLTSGALTKLKATMGVMLGWDGTTHRELSVDTAGKLNVNATVTASVPIPTASLEKVLTESTSYTVPAGKYAKVFINSLSGTIYKNSNFLGQNYYITQKPEDVGTVANTTSTAERTIYTVGSGIKGFVKMTFNIQTTSAGGTNTVKVKDASGNIIWSKTTSVANTSGVIDLWEFSGYVETNYIVTHQKSSAQNVGATSSTSIEFTQGEKFTKGEIMLIAGDVISIPTSKNYIVESATVIDNFISHVSVATLTVNEFAV